MIRDYSKSSRRSYGLFKILIPVFILLTIGISCFATMSPAEDEQLDVVTLNNDKQVSPQEDPFFTPFIGAELFANLKPDSLTRIILKKYVDGRADIPATEIVAIHEREAKMLYQILPLNLEKQMDVDSLMSPDCGEFLLARKNVKEVYYSAQINLSTMPGGYDVVWMSQLGGNGMEVAPEDETGISLTLLIRDPKEIQSNTSSELNRLMQYDFCSGKSYQIPLTSEDADGDKLKYSISSPNSYWASENESLTYPEMLDDSPLPGIVLEMGILPRKLLLSRPPFRPFSQAARDKTTAVEADNPNILTINNGLKSINLNSQTTTRQLIGINIAEQRIFNNER